MFFLLLKTKECRSTDSSCFACLGVATSIGQTSFGSWQGADVLKGAQKKVSGAPGGVVHASPDGMRSSASRLEKFEKGARAGARAAVDDVGRVSGPGPKAVSIVLACFHAKLGCKT